MLRYIQKGIFIPDTPTDIANIGAYGQHITDLPNLIQSYINQGLITIQSGGSGWELTGNAGTDYETNFVGTTDSQPLVLASNSIPMMVMVDGEMLISSSNVLDDPIDAFRIEAKSDMVKTEIYVAELPVMKHTLDTSGFFVNKDGFDIFSVNYLTGYIGIGTGNNEPTVTLDVLGDVLARNETDVTITASAYNNALFLSETDAASQYYFSGFKSQGDGAYLQMGMTGTDWGDDNYSKPYLNNVGYIVSNYSHLVLDSISDPSGRAGRVVISCERQPKVEIASGGMTLNPDINSISSNEGEGLQINQIDNSTTGVGLKLVSSGGDNHAWDISIDDDEQLALAYNLSVLGTFDKASGVYTSVSDSRLKQNVVPLADEALLLQLSPKQFTFKSDSTDKKRYGLIAQEVKTIIPEIVTGDENTGNLTVDYTSLIPLLIKQIQTLTAQVNALMV